MSYQTATFEYPKSNKGPVFSGGLVNNATNTLLADHYSPYLRNARLEGSSIITRPGHSQFKVLPSTGNGFGISGYLRSNPTNDRLIVRHNASATEKLVSYTDAGVATNITTASNITTDARMSFLNIGDALYCMNGTDFGKLVGTTYTNILSASHLPSAPLFSTFFAGCHWVGGTENTNWSNKLYKSPNNTYEDFTATGSDIFTFPENVTGVVASAQAIFAFTKNTIHTCTIGDQVSSSGVITFSFKNISTIEGANNNSTIVSVGSDVYYMTPTGKINKIQRGYNINGFEIEALSDKPLAGISTLTTNLDSDQSTATAHYYTQESVIKWFVKSKGSSFNDVCIVYDVDRQQFLQDTNKPFYDVTFFHGKNYALSAFNPTIFIDEYGTDDDGSGIDFEFWTKSFDEGESTLKKCYWESRTSLDISKLTELTQEVYTDSEVSYNGQFRGTLVDTKTIDIDNIDESYELGGIGTEPIGEFPIGMEGMPSTATDMYPVDILRTKGDLNKKGSQIAFRYYSNKVGAKVRLKRLGYKREILSGFATSLTN